MNICTGDGRVIVGGTISIPNGSTVSVNTTVDEYGGAQASGSTVSVSGGSTTLSGTCIVGGTFSPAGGLVIANGSTISGVGAGAKLDMTDCIVGWITNLALANIAIWNTCIRSSKQITFTNCYIHNGQNRSSMYPSVMPTVLERNICICTGCTIHGVGLSLIHSDDSLAYLKNCVLNASGVILVGGAPTKFENCTFNNGGAIGSTLHYLYFKDNKSIKGNISTAVADTYHNTIVFTGSNGLLSRVVYVSGRAYPTIVLASGSTLSLVGNTNQHIFDNCYLKVGTLTDDERPRLDTVSGTAIIITSTGSTITVSGEGTYLDNDGTTDLDRV